MKRTALLAASLAALLACSPKTDPAAQGAAPGEAAQKRMPLPDCTEVEPTDAGLAGWAHPDCRMQSADSKGLAYEARYTAPVEGQQMTVTVQVVAPGDATLQTITEKMGSTFSSPALQDIDKDGRDEILIPLMTGNVNTTWAVWRTTGDKTEYARLEELSGIAISKTESGYIVTPGRSSANSWAVDFWKFDGEDLEPIATADVTAEIDSEGAFGKITCEVTDKGGLADTGMTPEAAKAAFCAEPDVKGLF